MIGIERPLVALVSRTPARVQTKLLAAFLAIAALLVLLGAVGLQVLSGINRRTETLIQSQRKIAAYRQIQHDTVSQLYGVSSALLESDDRAINSALRQLNQFGYDLERLEFVAKGEIKLLAKVRRDYDRFIGVATREVGLIRDGKLDEARAMQLKEARPLADRLERLTNELVNKAEADVVAGIDATGDAYRTSRAIVIGFALGSVGLALLLGRAMSWSLIGPINEIDARLNHIAAGDFSQRAAVANRDELGALAAKVNQTSAQLALLYEELEAASRHKSAFLANMSHELRTPLNAILGYAELMADGVYGEMPPRAAGVLERVQNNGKHLLALINDVLDLSKIEAGQLTLSLEDYALPDVVLAVVSSTEGLANSKGLKFTADIMPGLPTGHGDARRLSQVLLNLVGNAVKFTDTGEVAIAALAEDGALAEYSGVVADSGEGRWTLAAALDEAVPAMVLSAALYARFRSRDRENFADKLLSAMRKGFGGHVEPKAG